MYSLPRIHLSRWREAHRSHFGFFLVCLSIYQSSIHWKGSRLPSWFAFWISLLNCWGFKPKTLHRLRLASSCEVPLYHTPFPQAKSGSLSVSLSSCYAVLSMTAWPGRPCLLKHFFHSKENLYYFDLLHFHIHCEIWFRLPLGYVLSEN